MGEGLVLGRVPSELAIFLFGNFFDVSFGKKLLVSFCKKFFTTKVWEDLKFYTFSNFLRLVQTNFCEPLLADKNKSDTNSAQKILC